VSWFVQCSCGWRGSQDYLCVVYDEGTGLHPQVEGYPEEIGTYGEWYRHVREVFEFT
jgi:hypothetical protein